MVRSPQHDQDQVEQIIKLKKQNLDALNKHFKELSKIYADLYPIAMLIWSGDATVGRVGKDDLYSRLNSILERLVFFDKRTLAWKFNEEKYRQVLPDEVIKLIDEEETLINSTLDLIKEIMDKVNRYETDKAGIRKLIDELDKLLMLMKEQVFKE